MKPSSLMPKLYTELDGSLCLAYNEGYGSKLKKNTPHFRMFLDGSVSSNLGFSKSQFRLGIAVLGNLKLTIFTC